jgi:hypothetical protein
VEEGGVVVVVWNRVVVVVVEPGGVYRIRGVSWPLDGFHRNEKFGMEK